MTKHDEVRQILHETGFKFEDGRSALEMTDEEVEAFVVIFLTKMAELGRAMTKAFQGIIVAVNNAMPAMQNVTQLLAEAEAAQLRQQSMQ